MTTLIVRALVCPLMMVGMMIFMRGRRPGGERRADDSEQP
jgi:hypothetical protein